MTITLEDTVDEQVTLSGYADQVRELIRHDRNDEAIAICKHLLRYYPKYINAYRQMGEALLEKQEYDGAKEMFCRVLSADPENAVAYVGLATIYEQDHVINEAAWNMERAFELAPGNSELQHELVRLYNELEIKAHTRAKLTAGALARIYAQEGLFGQAIQEFRAIIASAPARYDIRVALAETLWRMGRMSEAAQVAQGILAHLPYCLKANLILGAAWKEIGLSESDVYLERAQALDPMNQTAVQMFGARTPLPAQRISVPRYVEGAEPTVLAPAPSPAQPAALFDDQLTQAPAAYAPAEPTVATSIPQEPAAPMTTDDSLPAWLRRLPGETVAPLKTESLDEASSDWLTKLRESVAETAETPPATEPTIDWLSVPITAEPAPLPADGEREITPTWLDSTPAESLAEAPSTEPSQTTPDWMRDLAEPTESAAPRQTEPATSEELPAWLAPSTPSADVPAEELPGLLAQPVVLPVSAIEPQASPPAQPPAPLIATPAQTPAEVAPVFEPPAPPPVETIVADIPAAPVQPKRKRQPKGYPHLVQARAHRDAQRWHDALAEYDYVVQHAPRLVRDVIDDLEVLIQRIDIPLEAHRILGDAYTRVDRLAEALERYRFVLEHVS